MANWIAPSQHFFLVSDATGMYDHIQVVGTIIATLGVLGSFIYWFYKRVWKRRLRQRRAKSIELQSSLGAIALITGPTLDIVGEAPDYAGPFIGRDTERAKILDAIFQNRPFAVVGPGGAGVRRIAHHFFAAIGNDGSLVRNGESRSFRSVWMSFDGNPELKTLLQRITDTLSPEDQESVRDYWASDRSDRDRMDFFCRTVFGDRDTNLLLILDRWDKILDPATRTPRDRFQGFVPFLEAIARTAASRGSTSSFRSGAVILTVVDIRPKFSKKVTVVLSDLIEIPLAFSCVADSINLLEALCTIAPDEDKVDLAPVPDEVIEQMVNLCEHEPFRIQAYLPQIRSTSQRGGTWWFPLPQPPSAQPERDAYAQFSDDEQRVMRYLAIYGRPVPYRAIQSMDPIHIETLTALVENLRNHFVLVRFKSHERHTHAPNRLPHPLEAHCFGETTIELHERYTDYLLSEVIPAGSGPEELVGLHLRAARYYSDECVEYRNELKRQTGLESGYRWEHPVWQDLLLERAKHLYLAGSCDAASFVFTHAYFEALDWWRFYCPFEFASKLLKVWRYIATEFGRESDQWRETVLAIESEYPYWHEFETLRTVHTLKRWQAVEKATDRILGLINEFRSLAEQPIAPEQVDRARTLALSYRGDARAFLDPNSHDADGDYDVALHGFLEQNETDDAAWILLRRAKLALSREQWCLAREIACTAVAMSREDIDNNPDLESMAAHVVSDACLAEGKAGEAIDHALNAIRHAYRYFSFERKIDHYTRLRYAETLRRATLLFGAVGENDRKAGFARARELFRPFHQDRHIEAEEIHELSALVPPCPAEDDLGFSSPYLKRCERIMPDLDHAFQCLDLDSASHH